MLLLRRRFLTYGNNNLVGFFALRFFSRRSFGRLFDRLLLLCLLLLNCDVFDLGVVPFYCRVH